METITLTDRQQREVRILERLETGSVDAASAAKALGISARQLRRKRACFRAQGIAAVVLGNQGRRPVNRMDEATGARIVTLAGEGGRYAGVNVSHMQELCNPMMKDYDSKLGRLQIRHGKGNKNRLVFVGESARKALWRYISERGELKPTDLIFVTHNDAPMDTPALRHRVQACTERAGMERANVHQFRHTFAISFLRNGGSVLELQRMLGHEQLNTVPSYASLAESDLQEA